MKRTLSLLSFLALLGCAGAEISTPPVTVTPKDPRGAVGVDVYAKARAQGNPVPRFRGQETVQIRSFGTTDKGRSELSGVPCTAETGLYKASFVTPANLIVPDYGPDSPALFVRCVTEGKSGSVTVNAINATAQQRQNAAIGTGILGAIIIGAVAAANNNPETDDFKYPPIVVNLKEQK